MKKENLKNKNNKKKKSNIAITSIIYDKMKKIITPLKMINQFLHKKLFAYSSFTNFDKSRKGNIYILLISFMVFESKTLL